MSLVEQPTAAPTRKVSAAGLAGALVVLLAYVIDLLAGIQLPEVVTAALTTVVTVAVAYVVKERAI